MVKRTKKRATAWRLSWRQEPSSEARALFSRIGKQLGQRAIYFEVREGGKIIDLEQVKIPMSKRSTEAAPGSCWHWRGS